MEKAIVKFKFDPQVFDPNKEQLLAIKNEVANITADPTKITKEELELVNTTKNKLVKARTRISEIGKEMRTDALVFQKEVIAYENSLIEIIEPEELRLKAIEKGAKEYAIREERKKILPEYIQQLASIGDGILDLEEYLLTLDPTQFQSYYNTRLGTHLEKQKAEQEAKIREEKYKIEKERDELEQEQRHLEELKVVEKRARELAELKAKTDAENLERKIKQETEAKVKAEQDAKIMEEQTLKVTTQKAAYQKFLTNNAYNAETDIVQHDGKISTLYRVVARYTAL